MRNEPHCTACSHFALLANAKMAATYTVAQQFEDAVEDQLQTTLEGRASNRYGVEEDGEDLQEEEGHYSFSDCGSSEEEDVVAWDWEGHTSDLTKKYNAARLVTP